MLYIKKDLKLGKFNDFSNDIYLIRTIDLESIQQALAIIDQNSDNVRSLLNQKDPSEVTL